MVNQELEKVRMNKVIFMQKMNQAGTYSTRGERRWRGVLQAHGGKHTRRERKQIWLEGCDFTSESGTWNIGKWKIHAICSFFLSTVSENRVQLAAWCSAKHTNLRAKPCIHRLLLCNCGAIPGTLSPFLTCKMKIIPPPLNLGCLQLWLKYKY